MEVMYDLRKEEQGPFEYNDLRIPQYVVRSKPGVYRKTDHEDPLLHVPQMRWHHLGDTWSLISHWQDH